MFQPVVTARLVIRDLRPDDAENMFRYRSDPEVTRYQFWRPASVDALRSFIEQPAGEWHQLGVTLQSTGELIGDCGIRAPGDPRWAEIGITLAPPFQGRGYAAEVLRAILNYLFGTLGKDRVFACVDPRNTRSIRLMQRAGFRQEAQGESTGDVIFAKLAGE